MYKQNDIVMHPGAGVCRIEAVREETFTKQPQLYYVLRPMYENDSTTIYVPTDSDKINLRRLLSREEIIELIRSVSLDTPLWIDNPAARRDSFAELLREGEHTVLIRLIAELHIHQKETVAAGRKFHAADEKVLQEAEKRIHQEFAHTLQLEVDEVAPFIMKEMGLS